jgi:TPR repeat protein
VASGCHLAGLALRDGEYVPRDTAGARALFDKGCELGSDAACTNVAVELRRADRKDEAREIEKRGFEVAGAGCDAGNLDDCYSQVFDLRFGWDTDTKAGQDEVRSAALASRIAPVYEKLCRQGDADACMRAGRLAKGFVGDKPSPADIERSLPHYERACELDATLCWTVGSLNEDLGRSGRSYFEKACDADDDGSTCWDSQNHGDPVMAAKRLAKAEAACVAGKRSACIDLVTDQATTVTPSAATPEERKKQRARVTELLGGECDRKIASSCSHLASLLALDEKGELATGGALLEIALLHEKGCAAGDKQSCFEVGLNPLLKDVEAFFPSTFHACARKKNGKTVCWGVPSDGALGVPETENGWREIAVPLDERVVDMALAFRTTCALGESGTVRCWGQDPDRSGSSSSAHVPKVVSDFAGARALRASSGSVCAELPNDKVACRGGILRKGTERMDGSRALPLEYLDCVESRGALRCRRGAEPGEPFVSVEVVPAGGQLVANVGGLCSLFQDGTVSCVEHAFEQADELPRRIELKGVPGIEHAVEISVVRDHGCARLKDGTVACWELPNGAPKKLEGIDDATQLTKACATTKRGFVFCWGGRYGVPWGVPEVLRITPGGIKTE